MSAPIASGPGVSRLVVSVLASVLIASSIGCGIADQAAECEARIVRMERTIAAVPQAPIPFAPADVDAPTSHTGITPTDVAPIVRISADRAVRFDGRTVDAAQMRQDVETMRRNWPLLHPRRAYPGRVDVWADRSLSLADVRAALAGTEDHRVMVLAYDTAPRAALPTCPASLGAACARIAASAYDERGDALSAGWTMAVGSCRPLIAMLGALPSVEARAELMRTAIPEGLRACGCRAADANAIEYLAVLTIGNSLEPHVLALELPPPSASDATTTVGAWRAR